MASKETIELVLKLKDEASAKLKGVGASASGASGGFTKMAAVATPALAAIATSAITAAASIVALTQSVADSRNAISDMGKRTGVTAKTLAGLKLAAEGSGRNFEDLNEILNPLVSKLGQIGAGSATAEQQFLDFGVGVRDANGELLSTDDVLKNTIAALQGIEDPGQRASAAAVLLGESGAKLNQILGDTSLVAFTDQAERFGLDVGPAAAESAGRWQRSMADLSMVLSDASGDLADFLNIGPKLDGFVLGFVFVKEVVTNTMNAISEAMASNMEAMTDILAGDFVGAARTFEAANLKLGSSGEEAMQKIMDKSEAAAKVFFDNRNAIIGGTEGGAAPSAPGGSGVNVNAAKATAAKRRAPRAKKAAAPANLFGGPDFSTLVDSLEKINAPIAAEKAAAEQLAIENLAAFNRMVEEGTEAQAEARFATDLLADAETKAADAAAEAAQADIAAARGEAFGIGGIEGTLSGGFSGILTALGPAGAIAGAALSFATNLEPIIQGLIDNVDEIIIALVESLPVVLFELLPELGRTLVRELPPAIAQALATILDGLFGGKFGDAREGAAQSFADTGIDPRALGILGGILGGDKSFASGGMVGTTGMAMVHGGEEIIPQNGVTSSSQRGRIGGGGSTSVNLTVNVTGMMDASGADRLVEQLNRHIGPRGFGVASVS